MVLLTSIKCKIPSKALHFKVQTVFYILIIMLLITDNYKMYMKIKEIEKFIFWNVFTIHIIFVYQNNLLNKFSKMFKIIVWGMTNTLLNLHYFIFHCFKVFKYITYNKRKTIKCEFFMKWKNVCKRSLYNI